MEHQYMAFYVASASHKIILNSKMISHKNKQETGNRGGYSLKTWAQKLAEGHFHCILLVDAMAQPARYKARTVVRLPPHPTQKE
jgi:hypothetical protein